MTMDNLFQKIKKWLESKGFQALITGNSRELVIPIADLYSASYKIPDLIGANQSGRVFIIEVENDKKKFFDALGRCILWKCFATFVYLAFPEESCPKAPFLERIGIGLISINEDVKECVTLFNEANKTLFKTTELHPVDYHKELELAKYIRKVIKIK